MPLPFLPETLIRLRQRMSLCLAQTFDVREIKAKKQTPWNLRENVFDFESGLRLVISKEVMDDDADPCLHVCGCIMPHTLIDIDFTYKEKEYKIDREALLAKMIPGQFHELHPSPLEFLGFSDGGIPHFYGPLKWNGSRRDAGSSPRPADVSIFTASRARI